MVSAKPRAQPEDDFEVRAKKLMGSMEDGDVVFGSGAEVNLDSQVSYVGCFGNVIALLLPVLQFKVP